MEVEMCRHPLCTCQVAGGNDYCSPTCANASQRDAGEEAASCACPHSECKDGSVES